MNPYKQLEKLPINWCRISAINSRNRKTMVFFSRFGGASHPETKRFFRLSHCCAATFWQQAMPSNMPGTMAVQQAMRESCDEGWSLFSCGTILPEPTRNQCVYYQELGGVKVLEIIFFPQKLWGKVKILTLTNGTDFFFRWVF